MNIDNYTKFCITYKSREKKERSINKGKMPQGRPKKEIKREYCITIWLTEEELDKLNKFCEEWGYNRGNVSRCAIMKYIREWRTIK